MAADVASVQFSRTVERRITPVGLRALMVAPHWRVLAATGGRRSLKTQQHAGIVCGRFASSAQVGGFGRLAAIQPGSVDMLGPIRLVIA